jgi:hypothetical protein
MMYEEQEKTDSQGSQHSWVNTSEMTSLCVVSAGRNGLMRKGKGAIEGTVLIVRY